VQLLTRHVCGYSATDRKRVVTWSRGHVVRMIVWLSVIKRFQLLFESAWACNIFVRHLSTSTMSFMLSLSCLSHL